MLRRMTSGDLRSEGYLTVSQRARLWYLPRHPQVMNGALCR